MQCEEANVSVSACITYECGFISFQETLREKEWKWVSEKRQDIYNKLCAGLLLLLLSSSSSSIGKCIHHFSVHIWFIQSPYHRANTHTQDLHPEIYLSMCYLYSIFASAAVAAATAAALPTYHMTCKKCMGICVRMCIACWLPSSLTFSLINFRCWRHENVLQNKNNARHSHTCIYRVI